MSRKTLTSTNALFTSTVSNIKKKKKMQEKRNFSPKISQDAELFLHASSTTILKTPEFGFC